MEQDEYQKVYDTEMARLNGEAAPVEVATTEPEAEVIKLKEEPIAEETPSADKPIELDVKTLAEQLEATNKALKDTQRWGHQNAAELKALKKEREELERAKSRPEILDAFDGLEDAIRHVARVETPQQEDANEKWLSSVQTVIPEIEKLLEVPEFQQAAVRMRDQLGDSWLDPLVAARELGNLRSSYYQHLAINQAKAAAAKDYEAKSKKLTAMSVPGGSGKSAPTKLEGADEVWAMSDEDFIKQRTKVLGY